MSKLTPVFASLAFIAAAPVTAHAADLYDGGYAGLSPQLIDGGPANRKWPSLRSKGRR